MAFNLLAKCEDDKLHKLLLKKIRLEIGQGKVILQIGTKHNQVTDMLAVSNILQKVSDLDEISLKKKSYSYVIADIDSVALDDLESFLEQMAPTIIRPGLLIMIGTDLCTLKNKIKLLFDHLPDELSRPIRAVPTNYIRDLLLKKGFYVKNRFWSYDDKFLIMADIPKKF